MLSAGRRKQVISHSRQPSNLAPRKLQAKQRLHPKNKALRNDSEADLWPPRAHICVPKHTHMHIKPTLYLLHTRYYSKLCTCTCSALAILTWSWAITLLCVNSEAEAHRVKVLFTRTLHLGFGHVRLTSVTQDSHRLWRSTVYKYITKTKTLKWNSQFRHRKGIKTGISKSPKHNTFQKEEVANSFTCASGYTMPAASLLSMAVDSPTAHGSWSASGYFTIKWCSMTLTCKLKDIIL